MDILLIEDNSEDAVKIQALLVNYEKEHTNIRLGLCWVSTRSELEDAITKNVWSVILCDYSLPDMPWPTVLELVSKLSPTVPLILISGHLPDLEGIEAIRLGAVDFVSKKDMHMLGHVIVREAIQAKTYNDLIDAHTKARKGTGPLKGGDV